MTNETFQAEAIEKMKSEKAAGLPSVLTVSRMVRDSGAVAAASHYGVDVDTDGTSMAVARRIIDALKGL
jgi:hypothetical protein